MKGSTTNRRFVSLFAWIVLTFYLPGCSSWGRSNLNLENAVDSQEKVRVATVDELTVELRHATVAQGYLEGELHSLWGNPELLLQGGYQLSFPHVSVETPRWQIALARADILQIEVHSPDLGWMRLERPLDDVVPMEVRARVATRPDEPTQEYIELRQWTATADSVFGWTKGRILNVEVRILDDPQPNAEPGGDDPGDRRVALARSAIRDVEVPSTNWGWTKTRRGLEEIEASKLRLRLKSSGEKYVIFELREVSPDSLFGGEELPVAQSGTFEELMIRRGVKPESIAIPADRVEEVQVHRYDGGKSAILGLGVTLVVLLGLLYVGLASSGDCYGFGCW